MTNVLEILKRTTAVKTSEVNSTLALIPLEIVAWQIQLEKKTASCRDATEELVQL